MYDCFQPTSIFCIERCYLGEVINGYHEPIPNDVRWEISRLVKRIKRHLRFSECFASEIQRRWIFTDSQTATSQFGGDRSTAPDKSTANLNK